MIFIAIAILIVLELTSYTICHKGPFKSIIKMHDILSKKNSKNRNDKTSMIRYIEHPFLGFSLSPEFRNSLGEKIHNKYGFRSMDDFDDINEKDVIYCAGGSSTYCINIEQNRNTWPNVLNGELKNITGDKKIQVINAACSGWTSFQSLIRFSGWIDVLKPKLVVIYHGKNDFAPFVNGKLSEKEIFPDYGNVMHSLRLSAIAKKIPDFIKFSYTAKVLYCAYLSRVYMNVLWRVYATNRNFTQKESNEGLKRINYKEWEFLISRYRSFAALCKERKIPILFVTQKVRMKRYEAYMEELNMRIKTLENKPDKCFVYDFDKEINDEPGILYDHIHFTEIGARFCGKAVANYIAKNIFQSKK